MAPNWDFNLTANDRRRDLRAPAETLAARLDLLRLDDKQLVELYLQHGLSFRSLARVTGCERRRLARRLRRLLAGLTGQAWITILRHRQKFTNLELQIAYEYLLLALSRREIARRHHLGWRRANSLCVKLDAFVRGQLRARGRRDPRASRASPPGRRPEPARQNPRIRLDSPATKTDCTQKP